jgi:hypothetical protein
MSWSVNAKGKPADVKAELARQFTFPLADKPAGLSDDGERETVRRVSGTIAQCLETFDPEGTVTVIAGGHMGYRDWSTKAGAFQNVTLSITPSI